MNQFKKKFLVVLVLNVLSIVPLIYGGRVKNIASQPSFLSDAPSSCLPMYQWATVLYLPYDKPLTSLQFTKKNGFSTQISSKMLANANSLLNSKQKVSFNYNPKISTDVVLTLAGVDGEEIKIPYKGTETIYVRASYTDGCFFLTSFDTDPNSIGCVLIQPTGSYMRVPTGNKISDFSLFVTNNIKLDVYKVVPSPSQVNFIMIPYVDGLLKKNNPKQQKQDKKNPTIEAVFNKNVMINNVLTPIIGKIEKTNASQNVGNQLVFRNAQTTTPFLQINSQKRLDGQNRTTDTIPGDAIISISYNKTNTVRNFGLEKVDDLIAVLYSSY